MSDFTTPYGYGTWARFVTLAELDKMWGWQRTHPEVRRRAWAMFQDAARHGHALGVGGAARSYKQQLDSWLRDPQNFARPGSSYHEDNAYEGYGVALDLIGGVTVDAASKASIKWMNQNCYRFGFHHFGPGDKDGNPATVDGGRTDEPWHVQPIEFPTGRSRYAGQKLQTWNLPIIVTPVDPEPLPPIPAPNPQPGVITVDLPYQELTTELGREFNQFTANVQALLNGRAGREVVEVDGYYGPKTEAIVKLVQSEEGLKVDGRCGPKTLQAIWDGRGRG